MKVILTKITNAQFIIPLFAAALSLAVLPVKAEEPQFGGRPAQEGAERSSMFPPGQKPIIRAEANESGVPDSEIQKFGWQVTPIYVPTLMCCDVATVPNVWVPMCPMVVPGPIGTPCSCPGAFGVGVGLICLR